MIGGAIALANKMACALWTMPTKREDYRNPIAAMAWGSAIATSASGHAIAAEKGLMRDRTSAFPERTHPTDSVTGMPKAV